MLIYQRGKIYQLRKRVPRRFASVESRQMIEVSLHTDSESIARRKADVVWGEMMEAWEARLAGNSADAEARFEAARDVAQRRGFRYLTVEKVAQLPDDQFLERLRAVPVRGGKPDEIEAAVLLGGVPEPPITVTRALDLYWHLARSKTVGKSPDQVRKWKNPIKQAIRDFVAVVGDKPLADIAREDVRAFRDWWLERLERENLNPSTVNKNIDHFGKVLKLVNEEKGLGITLPLGNLRLEEGEKNTRPPFSTEWIISRILAPGALDGLHPEAQAILRIMVNTGARPSEIAALTQTKIRLQVNVPHISIEPARRKLKTRNARRIIPLVGVSLEAARRFPEGFPHYSDNPQLSKDVSDYLTAAGLRETPAHSLYSLRHSFEDRLLAAGVDERIRRDLMGHRLTRERYGVNRHTILTPYRRPKMTPLERSGSWPDAV